MPSGGHGAPSPLSNDAPAADVAAGDRAGGEGKDASGERTAELEGQLQEQRQSYLRLAADFDNFKKRVRQEQADGQRYAASKALEALLPAVDNLQRVLETAPADVDEPWLKGLRLTVQHLEEALREQGLTPIQAVGQPFDPSHHEAIGYEETDEQPEDTVVTEVRRGYRLHDRVIRPALVKVSRPGGR